MRLVPSTAVVLSVSGLLALTTGAAEGGPDETTSRLMDEFVSLLDFGLLRIQLRLDEIQGISPTSVIYDWDDNKVDIFGYGMDGSWNRERVEQACDEWFQAVRMAGGVDPGTGKIYPIYKASFYSNMFNHFGFEKMVSGKNTSEIVVEMDQKFRLSYTWYSSSSLSGEVASIACTGPLLDTGYSVKVETVEKSDSSP